MADYKKHKRKNDASLSRDQYYIEQYEMKDIKDAHAYCMNNFKDAIDKKVSRLIVDNTNILSKQYDKYIKYGEQFNYNILIFRNSVFKSRHGEAISQTLYA
eukprot:UN33811